MTKEGTELKNWMQSTYIFLRQAYFSCQNLFNIQRKTQVQWEKWLQDMSLLEEKKGTNYTSENLKKVSLVYWNKLYELSFRKTKF